jgi:hypothetical protein
MTWFYKIQAKDLTSTMNLNQGTQIALQNTVAATVTLGMSRSRPKR